MSNIRLVRKDENNDKLKNIKFGISNNGVKQLMSDANESFNTLQKYRERLDRQEYLSKDDLKIYETAMNSYVKNSNRLRSLSKALGQGYDDEQEKEWNDSVSSMQSGYKTIFDFYSKFENELGYNDAKKVSELNSLTSAEIKPHIDNHNYATKAAEKKLKILNTEKTTIQARMQGYARGHLQYTEQYKSDAKRLEEINAEINALNNDTSDIAYTTSGGDNITWSSLYNSKKYEEDFNSLYNEMSTMPDWKEQSKYKPTYDTSKGGRTPVNSGDYDYERANFPDVSPNGTRDIYYAFQTNEKEKELFNYLAHTKGTDYALNWLMSNEDIYKERAHEQNIENARKFAEEVPVLSDVIAVAASLVTPFEYLGNVLTGNVGERTTSADFASAIKSTRMEQIDWEVGNWDVFDFLYSTGTSMAESALSMGVYGGFGGVSLGLNAAAQSTNDALNRGMSKGQAFLSGVASGVFEGVFETWQIGSFKKLTKNLSRAKFRDFAKYVGKNMWNNAKEETLTEIADIVFDTTINGDFSQYDTNIRKYMRTGMSEKDSKTQVAKEFGIQIAEAAGSGALMGFGFGVAGSVSQKNTTVKKGKLIKDAGQVQRLVDLGISFGEGTESYKFANEITEKSNPYAIGQLLNTVSEEIKTVNKSDIVKNLQTKGYDAKKSNNVADLMLDSKNEIFKNSRGISVPSQTYNDLIRNPNSTVNQRNSAYKNIIRNVIEYQMSERQAENPKGSLELTNTENEELSGDYLRNSTLQSGANGGIINQNTGGGAENVGGQGLLRDGGRWIGSENPNTQISSGTLPQTTGGIYEFGQGNNGQQGRLPDLQNNGDNRGLEITSEQNERLKGTVIVNEDGTPKATYHFTDNMDFDTFGEGDIGFHFGSESQAARHKINLRNKDMLKGEGRTIKAHLAIKNPIYVSTDIMSWRPSQTALKLSSDGIITSEQYIKIRDMQIKNGGTYNTPAAVELRRILAEKGYDGIVYDNYHEGDGESYIAFYPQQVIIVDDGKGNTQATSNTEAASFMPKNESQTPQERNLQAMIDATTGKNVENGDKVKRLKKEIKRYNPKTEGQKEAKRVADELGLEVVFEDTVETRGGYRNGYIDENNVIHIDFREQQPAKFVLVHELTHYCEQTGQYGKFTKALKKSKLYEQWLHETTKMPNAKVEVMEARYRNAVIEQRGWENTKDAVNRADREMVADFCGTKLFGVKDTTDMQTLLDGLTNTEKQTVMKVLSDFFKRIGAKLTGNATTIQSLDLAKLERLYSQMYVEAKNNPTKKGEFRDSIGGPNALTANKSKLFEAINRNSKGENPETVRRETGWYKGKDGKWRFYIPDNELNVDALSKSDNTVQILGDCIIHNKLFAAYPELKNIKIRFDDLGKTKKGTFFVEENEIILNNKLKGDTEKIKDTLVHELQHAIQYIEGFATGGNKDIGFIYAMNIAYNKAKNTSRFNQLSTNNDKLNYLIMVAQKIFNADSYEKMRYKAYQSIYGETEARQVTHNRLFDEDLLRLATPDISGNVVNIDDEGIKFIENFIEMGYTKEEIINLFGGMQSDESGSSGNIAESNSKKLEDLRRTTRNNIEQADRRNTENNIGSRKSTGDMGRGIRNEVSKRVRVGRMGRGIESDSYSDGEADLKESAFSMPETKDSITVEFNDVDSYTEEQYNNFGWITDNQIVTAKERGVLFSRYADYKHNGDKYPTTRFEEAVIHSTECPDVIMYIKGDIGEPNVTKVVRINANYVDVKEMILRNERAGYNQPFKAIEALFGEEILNINYKRDYESFRQVKARIERERSQTGNTDSGAGKNRTGSIQQNSRLGEADLKASAFSMPETKDSITVEFDDVDKDICEDYNYDSHYGERLRNTPQHLRPSTDREWQVFCRSFANKTNGIKEGEHKSITIFTADNQYLVSADGYMSGVVISKANINDYDERIRFYGNYPGTDVSDYRNEKDGNRHRDDSYGSNPFKDEGTDTFDVELAAFIESHPEWFADNRETYRDYKRRVEAERKDSAFSMPEIKDSITVDFDDVDKDIYEDYNYDSHYGERLHNTPQRLRPSTDREWQVFCRSFANKTNGMKKGEYRNIDIFTDKYMYLVEADGYMSGIVYSKIDIDNYESRGYIYDNIRDADDSDRLYEIIGDRQGNNGNSSSSSGEETPAKRISEMVSFIESHPEWFGDKRENYRDYKRRVEAERKDSAFSMPETKDSITVDMESEESQTEDFTAAMRDLSQSFKNGELTSDEFLHLVNELYNKAGEQHGTIKKGETVTGNERFDSPVPKSVSDGKKVGRFARTIIEGGELTDEMISVTKQQILSGDLSYTPSSNEKVIKLAQQRMANGNPNRDWQSVSNGDKTPSAVDMAVGELLLKQAIESKDAVRVVELTAELVEVGTRLGQAVQALSLLKRMDGISQLVYIQRCVDGLNRDLAKRFKKNFGNKITAVEINEDLALQLARSKTEADFEISYYAIIDNIANQVPSTFLDKFNAWRYLAMLFNSTTHIRNFLGNAIFIPSVKVKNIIAAAIENVAVDTSDRTKSLAVKKEYKDFAKKDFANVKDILTEGGKMNPKTSIADNRRIFKSKALETIRKSNFELLEKEDMIFLKYHYAQALGGYLQARKISIDNISHDVLQKARLYAMGEALKATYRDVSKVANIISQISRSNAFANIAVEGLLPFKKTPINIVKRGVEYSPLGLVKTLGKAVYDLNQDTYTATEFIDGLASNFTGAGIMVLGMLLASCGVVTGGFDDDDESWFRKLMGEQEYSVVIGNKSYTIDWLAPACIPFFMGVAIAETWDKNSSDSKWQGVATAVGAGLEPIVNLSMLSGIQDTIASVRYSDANTVIQTLLGNMIGNYFSQLLPTVGGKLANTIDDTRRTTYIDKNSDVPRWLQTAFDTVAKKTPLLSQTRQEYINAWGETEKTGNVAERLLSNFVSPGYFSETDKTEVSEELQRLAKATGNNSVYPDIALRRVRFKNYTKQLSRKEYTVYATVKGQAQADYLKEVINNKEYKKLTDEQKAKVITDLYKFANAKAKSKIPYSYDELNILHDGVITKEQYKRLSEKARMGLAEEYFMSDFKKVYRTERNGGSAVDYYVRKAND